MNRRSIIVVIIFFTLLEAVLRSSHLPVLINLEFVYLFGIVFLIDGKSRLALFYIIISGTILDFIFGTITGISSLAFFGAALLIKFVYSINPLFDEERYVLRYLVTFILMIILKSILLRFINSSDILLQLPVMLANVACYAIVILIYERLSVPRNVLKS